MRTTYDDKADANKANLIAFIKGARNLEELAAGLNAMDGIVRDGGRDGDVKPSLVELHGVDEDVARDYARFMDSNGLASLPLFTDEEDIPENDGQGGVWSWDGERVLVTSDEPGKAFAIEERRLDPTPTP